MSDLAIHPCPPPAGPRVAPSFRQECGDTLRLALPLIAGQLGQMLMGVADTVMIGHLGVVELGAATFANTLVVVPLVMGIGLLTSVSVRVSHAHGAGRPPEAGEALRHGAWLALFCGLAVVAVTLLLLPVLPFLHQPPAVAARTPSYLLLVAASLVPAFLTMCGKNHADALNRPWLPFWILMGGVGLNVLLNWLWIYGHGGFPALGLEGAGLATLTARLVTVVALFSWMHRSPGLREWLPVRWLRRPVRVVMRGLLAIGVPSSLQMLTEVSAFAFSSLLIGSLGAVPLAAHQVAISCAATTFMIPLGIGMAITVRVGEATGRGEPWRRRRVLAGGWLFSLGFMVLSMLSFLLAGRTIAGWFVADPAVIEIAAGLLVVAGFFQVVDGVQVVAGAALRGVNDVRVPAWLALVCWWALAVPMGWFLGLRCGYGAAGIWGGLATGLGIAAAVLGTRAWRKMRAD